jgi:hypothetical protein
MCMHLNEEFFLQIFMSDSIYLFNNKYAQIFFIALNIILKIMKSDSCNFIYTYLYMYIV